MTSQSGKMLKDRRPTGVLHNLHEEERDSRWDSATNTQNISRKKMKISI